MYCSRRFLANNSRSRAIVLWWWISYGRFLRKLNSIDVKMLLRVFSLTPCSSSTFVNSIRTAHFDTPMPRIITTPCTHKSFNNKSTAFFLSPRTSCWFFNSNSKLSTISCTLCKPHNSMPKKCTFDATSKVFSSKFAATFAIASTFLIAFINIIPNKFNALNGIGKE